MNQEDDKVVILCWRVEDLPMPTRGPTSRGHYCSKCNAEVWLMLKNTTMKIDDLLCRPCGFALAAQEAAKGEPCKLLDVPDFHERN